MRRFFGRFLGAVLVVAGLGVVAFKAWLVWSGPYLEGQPAYPYCLQAAEALAAGEVGDALEFADAGGCVDVAERAEAVWRSLPATAERCAMGIWTGTGEDVAGVGCAIASDLVVFGDVRDLARQAARYVRGDEADTLLVALSAAGLVLTVVPYADAGTALVKAARRAGTLTERLTSSITSLVRQRSWRALGNLLGDAGRISAKVGPADAARALAYADTAEEVADVARFVERADAPLLALRWGGKRVTRIADDELYRFALARGPDGLRLAAARGARAMLSRQPFVVFAAKTVVRHPDAITSTAVAIARWVLTRSNWTATAIVAASLVVSGAALNWTHRRRPPRRSRAAPA